MKQAQLDHGTFHFYNMIVDLKTKELNLPRPLQKVLKV